MIVLETPRLRLRQFTPDDVDRLVELDSDPEVMRYITFGAPTPARYTPKSSCHAGLRSTATRCCWGTGLPRSVTAGRAPAERAAVKYSITRLQWQARRA